MEGLCASTGRRAWGTGGPSPRILFLHGSCLPPRHHPRPETRVSPRPLAWLSHKPSRSRGLCGPRGQNAAVLQGTALVAPRVNAGGGGTKAQGPHPERRQPSSKASARASPYPSLSFSDIPVPSPRLDPDTRKKKKKDTCAFEVGTMATPAALPPQGPVSSARSQHAPHPPGRLSPSRALATATLLLLVGGPGGAQQPGAKEPALCPGDLRTGLHWVSTERSCPAWGSWGRTRGAPASAPGPLLTKEDALLVGGLLEDPGTAHPGEVQAGGGGQQ